MTTAYNLNVISFLDSPCSYTCLLYNGVTHSSPLIVSSITSLHILAVTEVLDSMVGLQLISICKVR